MRSKWIPSYSLVMFAGRVALAATLALLCSLLLGLHEPHWAAWTAVSVGLPARGDGLLKSLNRAIGTAIGAPTGVLLTFAAQGSEPLLVGLLAAWLAVSVYAGLSLRHYRAYAAVLTGYSAVIIAMSLTGEAGQLFEVGRDRCAGIFIGIASALLVLLLSRDVQSGHASRRIRRAIATACTWAADRLAGLPRAWASDGTGPQRLRNQLSDILTLDGAVHSAVAESPALWARAGRLHKVVPALLDLLVVSRSVERNFNEAAASNNPISEEVESAVATASALLTSIAGALHDDPARDIEKLPGFRRQAQALRGMLVSIQAQNAIERRRIDLVSALLGATETALRSYAALTGERGGVDTDGYPTPVYALDVSYAIAAGLRAGFALLLAGAIWIGTGWQGGPLFVAFTAIAIALFAIRPDPRDTGRHFLASGAAGAGAAFLFYATASPLLPHAMGVSLAEGGIVFLGIVIASLLSKTFWASGFCLVFLVVSDPETIAHTTTVAISAHALGVLAGSALAALAFHLVPSRRLEHQWRKQRLRRIAGAIRALTASPIPRQAAEMRLAWQCHSIDTLVRLALPAASVKEVKECMAWIEIGGEVLKLKEASRAGLLPLNARKTIDDLLTDLQSLELQSWHTRLLVADAELREDKLSGNQHVLGTRAVVLELVSLIEHIATAESCADGAEHQLKSRSNAVWQ
ncbi:FUSC family protein [Paraburkholderia phytofirmans]|uniref:FUSC family protein n=1 Tax=Paraburkholderia phytofirmans TaxID=261302 RepID=UPI0038BB1EB9